MLRWLKSWLQNSGYYVYLEDEGQWEEVKDHLNPFYRLYDPAYTHRNYVSDLRRKGIVRIYFDDFWTGIGDCFHILLGNHYPNLNERNEIPVQEKKGRKGVLDLLIFPTISRRLWGFANYSFKHPAAQFFHFLSKVIILPVVGALSFTRYALATALTLALSPIIAAVHITTWAHGKILERRAKKLDVMHKIHYLDDKGDNNQPYKPGKLANTVANYGKQSTKGILHHLINSFEIWTMDHHKKGAPPDAVVFEKRARLNLDLIYLHPPEYYKTAQQKSELQAFLFFVDAARGQLETNEQFRNQYGPKPA